MSIRRYTDPVHRVIILDRQLFEDCLLMNIIDTPEFQRLHRIRQLGLAGMIFHGAEHSRFGHSLGAMHIMTLALDILERQGIRLERETRLLARMGALLHDIGHGPFSHVMEGILDESHENWTRQILLDPETALHQCLAAYDPTLPARLTALLEGKEGPKFVRQLISSHLDCDRLDYLLRDSLMTGVSYGRYDLPWILQTLTVNPQGQELMVFSRGVTAVEEYLFARYHMFRQVYLHPALRAAEMLLQSIFRRARVIFQEMPSGGPIAGLLSPVFRNLLRERKLSTKEYLSLDDSDMWFHIKQWQNCADPVLSDLCRRFVGRKLFKTLEIGTWPVGKQMEARKSLDSILKEKGWPSEFYLVEDNVRNVPYHDPHVPALPEKNILVIGMEKDNVPQEISTVSSSIRRLRPYKTKRLCFPGEIAAQIESLFQAGPERELARHTNCQIPPPSL